MADYVRNYIRRSRPELASYRTKKSFWEKLADGPEDSAPKKPASVPAFGEIRRKFNNNNNQRRSRASAKSNEAAKDGTATNGNSIVGTRRESPSSSRDSSAKDDLSKRLSRRRSLDKPKETFLHMTEVMEGHVPSDSDSGAPNKGQQLQNRKVNSIDNYKVSSEPRVPSSSSVNHSKNEPDDTGTVIVETSIVKTKSVGSNDGSFRKKNRIRRRGSGRESRFDAVKKEDIENAGLGVVTNGAEGKKDISPSPELSPRHVESTPVSAANTYQEEKSTATLSLTRPDSSDNPLKRKRDRKSQNLKLNTETKEDETHSPTTPTYEAKSVLSGIKLSKPKTPPSFAPGENKKTGGAKSISLPQLKSPERTVKSNITKTPISLVSTRKEKYELPTLPDVSRSSREPTSPKKYESVFMGKKRNFIYQVDSDQASEDVAKPGTSTGSEASDIRHSGRDQTSPQSVEEYYSSDGVKPLEVLDSSSDAAKAFDTIDSNCSEHRWSTIDSGISVACALQQNVNANKLQGAVQPSVISDVVTGKKTTRQRRRRPSTSSDSDDDSGISWDELKDVPLVIVDNAPDGKESDIIQSISNVKVELEGSIEMEPVSESLTNKKSGASSIGSRINSRWKIKQDDSSDADPDKDEPLRTSTPTGIRVPVVLEPVIGCATSDIVTDTATDQTAVSTSLESNNISSVSDPQIQTPKGRPNVLGRPSRLSKFLASKSTETEVSKPKDEGEGISHPVLNQEQNEKITNGGPLSKPRAFETTTQFQKKTVSDAKDDAEVKSRRLSASNTDFSSSSSSSKERVRSKSETAEPSFFQVRSRSLTRQLSPLDPMDDVLTKRSPFSVPSSLSSNKDSVSGNKRRTPSVSQYQKTHTHSRTNYNMLPNLSRAKSNPILYEPPRKNAQRTEKNTQSSIRPVIRPRESSLGRKKANPPPIYTPTPPQPTSLASRLLPQRRRSLHRSTDVESESPFYTPYTTDDEDGHSDSESKKDSRGIGDNINKTKQSQNSNVSDEKSLLQSSEGTVRSSGVFSESDNEEQTPKKTLAPSQRLRQKVRSRTSSVSSRPMDISFSDSEGVDGSIVTRKRRRSRSRTRSEAPEENSENNVNVHVTSTEAGDRKIDTLDSQQRSQARRQMSLSKSHRTSSKQVDKDSDLDSSMNDEQWQGSTRELKHMKDRNNNMISKQNKSRLSLEQLAEEEIIASASKLQVDLYKHKKHFEKDLSKKLENAMEESDNLVGALRKSMNEPRAKDKVEEAFKNISEVIKFDIIRDYRAKLQWYKVEVSLGSYTQNVDARKTSNFRVTVSCEMPDGPKFSKDIHLDFPESVDLSQLEILQVGDDLELRVPFSTWNPPPQTMNEVIDAEGGDPKDTFSRIGFLEKAYRSMGLDWPPEGATAHYEYLNTRGGSSSPDQNKRTWQPPEYQSLIDSGQLKACEV